MDFFKSVFSDDPDPPRSDPDPESPKKPSQSEEDDAPDAKLDPNPNPSAGGGWSFGGLIKTLTTKSESVIEIYRRDLQEFGTGLKHETAAFREVASRVVKELPASIEVGASEFGSSVLKGTAEIISHGKEALLAVDTDTDENAQNHSNQGVISKPFSRFDAQVRAIQNDVNTYVEEPDDLDDYNQWKLEFVLDDKGEEIQNLLEENGAMEGIYNRIVPKNVDQETFWFRYFYRVYKLKQAEDVRASLVKRAIMREDEEELSWDVEDEDEDDETTREVGEKNSEKMEKENRELGNKDSEKIVKKEESVEESGVGTSVVSLEKGENEVKVDAGDKGILTMTSENVSVSDEKIQLEVKKDELAVKSDEKVAMERKVDSGESTKESSVPVVASQAPEEEDLGWDEIEDLSSSDEKKVNLGSPANRDNVRKRLSAADEEEDLNWDIEDDDEPVKA
ncbi:hypothetical protein PVL29_008503 [Vitis rotundifolia]|uniref:BSD domain-containing protein n=1 Tax=Vitis rotundifolia TaxID=103349 RepID=A0AA38ZW04_VITRO|nr:hypothetical protein PVL29_008503 [Vitis rotundifolia]